MEPKIDKFKFTGKMEIDIKKATTKTTRKRKVPREVDSKTGKSSIIEADDVRDTSRDDVEDYIARNQILWNYFLDDNNFKYDK